MGGSIEVMVQTENENQYYNARVFVTASVLLFGALSHGRNRKSETRRCELGSGATNRVKD